MEAALGCGDPPLLAQSSLLSAEINFVEAQQATSLSHEVAVPGTKTESDTAP